MKIEVVSSIESIPAAAWDSCANPLGTPFNPFISHAFLSALEKSDSAVRKTGWLGRHLVVEDDAGSILGVAPAYLKSHSQGEYVFDHAWADAFQRAGGRYYPKLQVAVPFTPVTGSRLLAPTVELRTLLLAALRQLAGEAGASSVHITFLPEEDWRDLGTAPWLKRTDTQFHWFNQDYADFEGFLADLSSRKRKNIRKERETVGAAGIACEWVTGRDITETHWDHFFEFYMETGSRKWGRPYLTRRFFSLIGESMADRILLVFARRAGRIIAGALNFIGSDALYGRNWGAVEHHANLHFEACYYQAIDFAIARKLARVEAGAQGPHKLARGYVPRSTHSLHYLAHPGLSRAVADYLDHERLAVAEDQSALAEHAPFRNAVEDDF
ncbi:N-acetyltransferase [Nordella sp. HKS 07]|uniref:GNAT family N-acetyltransferase n=1 Tax=Nordella sp. HKS 07 TaxID=2712222 RepID=UPI0013E1FE32|nr:GNAT family N-acetyltransferase [Nordella sp. HKS 07]QIG51305.1 N-acetyltransferase [Nordella sp. HKS 07]